jgi:poly-beta-1,6-N-acetyl-D-glucosamine N-deacetylase
MFNIPPFTTLALAILLATPPLAGAVALEPASADAAIPRAVIFAYGRFGDDAAPSSIRVEQFEAHLEELLAGGYTVLPLPEILAAFKANRPLPEGSVAITIDQAWASVYAQAWPRLRRANLPFTVFVTTDQLDRGTAGGFMTWGQLREMAAAGVTVGNMTASHPRLVEEERPYVVAQIQRANERVVAEIGVRPTVFAYPYGEYGAELLEIMESQGFDAAFGQHSGVAHAHAPGLSLPRFILTDAYGSLERFRLAAQALPLYVADVTPDDLVLDDTDNPPALGFTVDPMVGDIAQLACFASGVGRTALETVGGRRVEARVREKLPSGRVRVNCTLPGPDSRWRWFGVQFIVQ